MEFFGAYDEPQNRDISVLSLISVIDYNYTGLILECFKRLLTITCTRNEFSLDNSVIASCRSL